MPFKIFLEELNRSGHNHQYIGNGSRLATCTGVKIIDDSHLVTTHFVGQKMYLFEYGFENGVSGHYKLLDTIDTTYHGQLITTDLLEYHDGKILTSNCEFHSVSLYTIDRQTWKFTHVKDFEGEGMGFCHGVKFYPSNPDIFAATSYRPDKCVYFRSISTGKILFKIHMDPVLPKDVCFVNHNHLIVIDCARFPARKPGTFYQVHIKYFKFDLENATYQLLDTVTIEKGHTDGCAFANNLLYLSDGLNSSVTVYRLVGNKLVFEKSIDGYYFPHGVDLYHRKNDNAQILAVANYGDNSTELRIMGS